MERCCSNGNLLNFDRNPSVQSCNDTSNHISWRSYLKRQTLQDLIKYNIIQWLNLGTPLEQLRLVNTGEDR